MAVTAVSTVAYAVMITADELGLELPRLLEHLQAVHAGHLHVDQQDRPPFLLQPLEGGRAVRAPSRRV